MGNEEAVLGRQLISEEHDAVLVRRLQAGEPEAARELYDRFAQRLFAYAAAHFPQDQEMAKDLMVQALAQAARGIDSFDPRKSNLTTWLYGVARRCISYELRQRGRRKSVPTSAQSPLDSLVETPDSRDMATDTLTRLHARRQIMQLSSVLSDLEFEVLVLSCLDSLSARQVGRIVGRSERAVHSLLHRARMKARERLAQDEQRDS